MDPFADDGPEYLDDKGDALEVYLDQSARVCIRQTNKPPYQIVHVHPSNIKRLCELLQLAAEHSLSTGKRDAKT